MEKIFVNVLGIEYLYIQNTWHWIRNQTIVVENIELCHSEESKIIFLQLPYFWLENNQSKLTEQIEKAEQVIISDLLNYDNNYNTFWNEILKKITHPNVICLTNNRLLHLDLPSNTKTVVNDFLFNRTKLYYFDTNKISNYTWRDRWGFWLHEANQYNLVELNKYKDIKRIFLSLTRILQNARRRVVQYLIDNYDDKGYIGCYELNRVLDNNYTKGYCPVPNQYYNETFAAIYCESTTLNRNIFHATEKTFEPLLKGIFVLPYSNTNFIDNLKKYYGFKFPDILDYSYDLIYDEKLDVDIENTRMPAYFKSIDSLCSLKVSDAQEYYRENFDIVEHNRNVFESTPYFTFVDKLWL